jgi:hypothetical protein
VNKSFNFNWEPDEESMKKGKKIYFRGVNRIHVNRFKAYSQILSNKLKYQWQITEEISQADAVATYQEGDRDQSVITLKLYTSSPNLNPPVLDQLNITFEEQSLIKQLNQAGRKLTLAKQQQGAQLSKARKIKLSGYPMGAAESLCRMLNENKDRAHNLHFKFISDVLHDEDIIFLDHLLFVVDPGDEDSVKRYFELENKRQQDDLTIDELTVVLMKFADCTDFEQVFDEIYDACDETTQVSLLNVNEQSEIQQFINYL